MDVTFLTLFSLLLRAFRLEMRSVHLLPCLGQILRFLTPRPSRQGLGHNPTDVPRPLLSEYKEEAS